MNLLGHLSGYQNSTYLYAMRRSGLRRLAGCDDMGLGDLRISPVSGSQREVHSSNPCQEGRTRVRPFRAL